jgi:DNA-binding CsgD family transcriptional regulator
MQDLATHVLIGTLTDRGELSAALETAARWQSGDRHARRSMGVVVACSQGRLELALGRPEQALARLEPAGATIEATGCVNPAGGEWRQPAALALAALDRTAEARELLSPALVAARRSGGAYELGVTLRAAALIEQPVNTDLLEEALGVLAPSEIRLQHARVLVDYGAALRRSGHRRDAREPLAAALEIAHACGAAEIAERARTELLATGARPRRIERTGADALTPSELRVARLARDGLSNREIAQQLFVSPRTVEAQLRTAYQKLRIGSRSELDGHGLSAPRPSARGARRRTLRQ